MGSLFSCNKNPEKNALSDDVTQGYFEDLKSIFIHNYINNDNLLSNMKICLDEKNFDQVIEGSSSEPETNDLNILLNNPNNEPSNFINWLDYLYNYLKKKKKKGRIWANHLLVKLDQEYFLMENKYLSQFFFEEYGILSTPDCIYKRRKRERKINVNTSILNVTQNLGGSFGESFNVFENENDAEFK